VVRASSKASIALLRLQAAAPPPATMTASRCWCGWGNRNSLVLLVTGTGLKDLIGGGLQGGYRCNPIIVTPNQIAGRPLGAGGCRIHGGAPPATAMQPAAGGPLVKNTKTTPRTVTMRGSEPSSSSKGSIQRLCLRAPANVWPRTVRLSG
jgi:hypothetical protein